MDSPTAYYMGRDSREQGQSGAAKALVQVSRCSCRGLRTLLTTRPLGYKQAAYSVAVGGGDIRRDWLGVLKCIRASSLEPLLDAYLQPSLFSPHRPHLRVGQL